MTVNLLPRLPFIDFIISVLTFGATTVASAANGSSREPSYRTEPVPGAQPGGKPRNPEDDVIDAIDELVSWQLENGKGR